MAGRRLEALTLTEAERSDLTALAAQPKTAQAAQPQAVQDVFIVRKLGDGWLIDSIGTMDAGRK